MRASTLLRQVHAAEEGLVRHSGTREFGGEYGSSNSCRHPSSLQNIVCACFCSSSPKNTPPAHFPKEIDCLVVVNHRDGTQLSVSYCSLIVEMFDCQFLDANYIFLREGRFLASLAPDIHDSMKCTIVLTSRTSSVAKHFKTFLGRHAEGRIRLS